MMSVWTSRVVTAIWTAAVFFAVNAPCGAQENKAEEEPIWVISWAVFFAFLAIAIVLIGMDTKRRESLLNEEEEKEYIDKLGHKRMEYYAEPDEDTDEDDD